MQQGTTPLWVASKYPTQTKFFADEEYMEFVEEYIERRAEEILREEMDAVIDALDIREAIEQMARYMASQELFFMGIAHALRDPVSSYDYDS
jgi:signal transduction histidine kinase